MESTCDQLLLATGGYDHTIKLWQAHTGNCIKSLRFVETSQVNSLDRTPDKTRLAACGYQCIRLYDLESNCNVPVINFEGVQKNVTRLGFQEDSHWMFTTGEDHRVRIWDMLAPTPHCSRVFDCQTPVNSACLHPNQVEIAMAGQNGGVYLWDVKSEMHEQLIPEMDAAVLDVAISPNGQYMAAVNNKGNCYVWSLISTPNQKLTTLQPKQKLVVRAKKHSLRCKFSPDSRLLVTTSADGVVCIWNTSDFTLWRELFVCESHWVWDAAFSADSKYLFTASSDGLARLWKLQTKTLERKYTGHTKPIIALSFRDEIVSE